MKSIAMIAACLATAVAYAADGQTSPPRTEPSAASQQSSQATNNRKAGASSNESGKAVDPSSTRGRPDAEYPRPSGQDAKTDAAAKPHVDKGHDDASDSQPVTPSEAAVPKQRAEAYTGSSGKKAAAGDCRNQSSSASTASASKPGATTPASDCAEPKRKSATAAPVPPGATAPMHQ